MTAAEPLRASRTSRVRPPERIFGPCPMPPQVRKVGPGSVDCGMRSNPIRLRDRPSNPELRDMTRRFLGVRRVWSVPLVALAMAEDFGNASVVARAPR